MHRAAVIAPPACATHSATVQVEYQMVLGGAVLACKSEESMVHRNKAGDNSDPGSFNVQLTAMEFVAKAGRGCVMLPKWVVLHFKATDFGNRITFTVPGRSGNYHSLGAWHTGRLQNSGRNASQLPVLCPGYSRRGFRLRA